MNTCATCIHWRPEDRRAKQQDESTAGRWGLCARLTTSDDHYDTIDRPAEAVDFSESTGAEFMTTAGFGCTEHSQ